MDACEGGHGTQQVWLTGHHTPDKLHSGFLCCGGLSGATPAASHSNTLADTGNTVKKTYKWLEYINWKGLITSFYILPVELILPTIKVHCLLSLV